MITWIQTILQKHNKWLFSLLLVIIIVAFVFTIGNTPGLGSGNRGEFRRDFWGFNINNQQEANYLAKGAQLQLGLQNQRPQTAQVEMAAYQRAVLISLANELEIPSPTEQQIAAYIQQQPAFIDPTTGQFSRNAYVTAIDNLTNSGQYTDETLAEMFSQNWRIEKVSSALAGPGYVLPYLAQREEEHGRTEWTVELAKIKFDPQQFAQPPSEEAIQEYFTQSGARYELPPEFTLKYVKVGASDFLDQVADPSEEELDAFYVRNLNQFSKDDNGITKPLDQIREEVILAYKTPQAARLAADSASELPMALFNAQSDGKLEPTDEKIAAFVQEQGYQVQETPTFSATYLPEGFPIPMQVLGQLNQLTDRRPYSDVILSDDAAFVVLRGKETEATMPELDAVRERVVADLQAMQEQQAIRKKGVELQAALQAGVDAGKQFNFVAMEQGLGPQAFSPFTLTDLPEGFPQYYLSKLTAMKVGQVSQMDLDGDEGTFIFLKNKSVPPLPEGQEQDLEQAKRTLGYYNSAAAGMSIMNDLITIGEKQATPQEF